MSSAPLGIVDSARKILIKRKLRGIDTVEFDLDERAALDSSQLIVENTLYMPSVDADAPLAFLLEQSENEDDATKNDLAVVGRTLDGIALDGRLAHPDPSNWPTDTAGHDEQTSVPAETAIKHYVEVNGGPTAHADRVIPGFAIATDAGRGSTVSYAARYESVLKACTELSLAADLGWKVTYESGTGLHTFEVIEPVDRSANVIFDFEFDSLESYHQLESLLDSRNVVLVAGQGELTDRDIVVRGSATGLQRREAFQDARDVELGNTTLLNQRGDAVLAASGPSKSIVATPRQFGPFQYTRDFHLGDRVRVRNYKRQQDFVAQIIEVWITVDKSASVPQVQCILDRALPTLQSRIGGSPVTGARQDAGGGSAGGGGGGGGASNLDGGSATTIYGGTTAIDGGSA